MGSTARRQSVGRVFWALRRRSPQIHRRRRRNGRIYEYIFSATGTPTPTFAIASGVLPPGLNLDPGGVLSGTPTSTGTFSFAIRATNGFVPDAISQSLSITVVTGVAPVFTGHALDERHRGDAVLVVPIRRHRDAGSDLRYRHSARAHDRPQYRVLSGTRTTPGVYRETASATNGVYP